MTRGQIAAIKLFAGVVFFVVLPLAGWGLADTEGFFSLPVRLWYIVLTVLLQVIVVMLLPFAGGGRGVGKAIVRRQRLAVPLLQLIFLAALFVAPWCDRRGIAVLPDVEILRWAGLTAVCLGMIMMLWAEAALGRQFSVEVTIQDGHELITTGPYRRLRHPRYSGTILYLIGIALVFRSKVVFVLAAANILVLLWRIHDEEELLHSEFGAKWEAYAGRTRRLVPFIY